MQMWTNNMTFMQNSELKIPHCTKTLILFTEYWCILWMTNDNFPSHRLRLLTLLCSSVLSRNAAEFSVPELMSDAHMEILYTARTDFFLDFCQIKVQANEQIRFMFLLHFRNSLSFSGNGVCISIQSWTNITFVYLHWCYDLKVWFHWVWH